MASTRRFTTNQQIRISKEVATSILTEVRATEIESRVRGEPTAILRQLICPERNQVAAARSAMIEITSLNPQFRIPADADLHDLYITICRELNSSKRFEPTRTRFENQLAAEISRCTRMKFYRSVWIGGRNIDFFFPGIKGPRASVDQAAASFRGLAIELDGPIHDREMKMKKDLHKYSVLHGLRIALLVIENRDVRHPIVRAIIAKISRLEKLCSRSRQLMQRRIFLETILRHANRTQLSQLFGADPFRALTQLRSTRKS